MNTGKRTPDTGKIGSCGEAGESFSLKRLYIRAGLWNQFPVRFAVLLSVLCLCAHVSNAQQQERKLEERIMKPDMTKGVREQNKSFNQYRTFESGTGGSGAVRDFHYVQKVSPKGFETKGFATKNHWAGDFKFATTEANTKGRYAIPNATAEYDTKPMKVKDARESEKTYDARTYDANTFTPDAKSQKLLDARYANQKPKTIDEIRELLNKNK